MSTNGLHGGDVKIDFQLKFKTSKWRKLSGRPHLMSTVGRHLRLLWLGSQDDKGAIFQENYMKVRYE